MPDEALRHHFPPETTSTSARNVIHLWKRLTPFNVKRLPFSEMSKIKQFHANLRLLRT